jgi:predicted lipoprotein with Yx(FWY)xxD motif
MKQRNHDQDAHQTFSARRIAWALLAIGGLSASVVTAGTAGAATSVTVSTAKNAKAGTVLVSGTTLYTLKPSHISCGTNCLKVWPPLLLPAGMTSATAGTGVKAAKLGTVKRGNALQVTYNGKALYFFFKDHPGQVQGAITDKWGKWAAVVTVKPAGSGSNSGSSGGSTAGSGGASF